LFWTLGKEALCQVPNKKHSAKKNTRLKALCHVLFTLGKEASGQRASLPIVFFCTQQIINSKQMLNQINAKVFYYKII